MTRRRLEAKLRLIRALGGMGRFAIASVIRKLFQSKVLCCFLILFIAESLVDLAAYFQNRSATGSG